jgi:hypothetical protein
MAASPSQSPNPSQSFGWIPAAVVWVWENLNPFLPTVLKKVSVIFYLKNLCPVEVPVPPPLNVMVIEADTTPFWIAVPGLLLLTLILLVPLIAGLVCLLVRSRRVMEALNVLAFAIALALGIGRYSGAGPDRQHGVNRRGGVLVVVFGEQDQGPELVHHGIAR